MRSQFLPHVSNRWLLVGAAVEFAINAWALWFLVRARECARARDKHPAIPAWIMFVFQTAMLAIVVAFVVALCAGAVKTASWLAAAFFASGLVTATLMRIWIHTMDVEHCERVPRAEFLVVDSINWMAIAGIVIKLIGFAVSLSIAVGK